MSQYRMLLQNALLSRRNRRRRDGYAVADVIINTIYLAAWAAIVAFFAWR